MSYIRNRKNNFQLQQLARRCEQELIKAFQRFAEQIYEEIEKIDDSPQLQNLLRIGNAFRKTCEKIGEDGAYFGTYFHLIDAVRNQDRKMEARMESYKMKYHAEDANKFRVTSKVPIDHISTISQSLKTIVTDYRNQIQEMHNQQEVRKTELSSTLEGNHSFGRKFSSNFTKIITKVKSSLSISPNGGNSLENASLLQKGVTQIHHRLNPEAIPHNREQIVAFRAKTSEENMKLYQLPLSFKDEIQLIKAFASELMAKLLEYESQGFCAHINQIVPLILTTYETIASQLESSPEYSLARSEQMKFRDYLRSLYRQVEDWNERVNVKYKDETLRNLKETKVSLPKFQDRLGLYPESREKLRIQLEDRRIWKELARQAHEAERAVKAQERAEAKKQKDAENVVKAQKRAEAKKQKDAENVVKAQKRAEAKKQKDAENVVKAQKRAEAKKENHDNEPISNVNS
ncbi:MAG: cell envelope integrity protein TolA [Promethearchaeota archaeon]